MLRIPQKPTRYLILFIASIWLLVSCRLKDTDNAILAINTTPSAFVRMVQFIYPQGLLENFCADVKKNLNLSRITIECIQQDSNPPINTSVTVGVSRNLIKQTNSTNSTALFRVELSHSKPAASNSIQNVAGRTGLELRIKGYDILGEEPQTLSWIIKPQNKNHNFKNDLPMIVSSKIAAMIKFDRDERPKLEREIIQRLIPQSPSLFSSSDGSIRNIESPETSLGSPLVIKTILSDEHKSGNYSRENPSKNRVRAVPVKNYIRATAEISLLYFIARKSYEAIFDLDGNDWMFEEGARWKDRWGYDDNPFIVNYFHAFAGNLYHLHLRSNGFSAGESYAFTALASLVWEINIERREVISINDEIFTTIGGAAIGETLFQLDQALGLFPQNGLIRMIRLLLNPVGKANSLLDRFNLVNTLEESQRPSEIHLSDIDKINFIHGLVYSMPQRERAELMLQVGMETHLSKLDLTSGGKKKKLFFDIGLFTELKFMAQISPEKSYEIETMMRMALAGYYEKNIIQESQGQNSLTNPENVDGSIPKRGYSYLVAATQGFSSTTNSKRDSAHSFAIVHVLGANLKTDIYLGDKIFSFDINVSKDFAMVTPLALGKFTERGTVSGAQPSLLHNGYLMSEGETVSMETSLRSNTETFGLNFRFSQFKSLDSDLGSRNVSDHLDSRDSYQKFTVFYSKCLTCATVSTVDEKSFDNKTLKISLTHIKSTGTLSSRGTQATSATHQDTENRVMFQFITGTN